MNDEKRYIIIIDEKEKDFLLMDEDIKNIFEENNVSLVDDEKKKTIYDLLIQNNKLHKKLYISENIFLKQKGFAFILNDNDVNEMVSKLPKNSSSEEEGKIDIVPVKWDDVIELGENIFEEKESEEKEKQKIEINIQEKPIEIVKETKDEEKEEKEEREEKEEAENKQEISTKFDELYNIKKIAEAFSLEEEFILDLLEDFFKQVKEEIREPLYKAFEEQDLKKAKELIHKIKGAASNLQIEGAMNILSSTSGVMDIPTLTKIIDEFYNFMEIFENSYRNKNVQTNRENDLVAVKESSSYSQANMNTDTIQDIGKIERKKEEIKKIIEKIFEENSKKIHILYEIYLLIELIKMISEDGKNIVNFYCYENNKEKNISNINFFILREIEMRLHKLFSATKLVQFDISYNLCALSDEGYETIYILEDIFSEYISTEKECKIIDTIIDNVCKKTRFSRENYFLFLEKLNTFLENILNDNDEINKRELQKLKRIFVNLKLENIFYLVKISLFITNRFEKEKYERSKDKIIFIFIFFLMKLLKKIKKCKNKTM